MNETNKWLDPKHVVINEITLDRIMHGLNQLISKEVIRRNVHLDIHMREMAHHIAVQVNWSLIGKIQMGDILFHTPKTWKDHFKLTKKGKWYMKRYIRKHPIELVEHIADIKKITIFPDVEVPDFKEYQNKYRYYYGGVKK